MSELTQGLPSELWFYAGAMLGLALVLLTLFVARAAAHRGISAAAGALRQQLEQAAGTLGGLRERLRERNAVCRQEAQLRAAETSVERAYERHAASVRAVLADYPSLHDRLSEYFTSLNADYERSGEQPPKPTDWSKAIRAVTEIPSGDEAMLGELLENIAVSMRKAEAKALESYRESSRERHKLLKRMMPGLHKVEKNLGSVQRLVDEVQQQGASLDRAVKRYQTASRKKAAETAALRFSFPGQLLLSSLLLLIGFGAAWVNASMLRPPLSALVGDGLLLGSVPASSVMAWGLSTLAFALGALLTECVGITRLGLLFGLRSDRARKLLGWAALLLLTALAAAGAGMGVLAGNAGLHLLEQAADAALWLQSAALALLPFTLALMVIPLETFGSAVRQLTGIALELALAVGVVLLRLLARLASVMGELLNRLYDGLICVPLWLAARRQSTPRAQNRENPHPDSPAGEIT